MTDYNDGKWHGWNGGECPVHPQSVVTIKWSCNGAEATERARCFDLWGSAEICAFRVVKDHREPREWWLYRDKGQDFSLCEGRPQLPWDETIPVREVIE